MLWEEDLSSEMERDGEEEREIQGDIVRVLAHSIKFIMFSLELQKLAELFENLCSLYGEASNRGS